MHILSLKQCEADCLYSILTVIAAANPHQMQQQILCLLGSFCMLFRYLWSTYHAGGGPLFYL